MINSLSHFQVYNDKLQTLKKQSVDFRYRLKENKARPKAIELLRNSLNLSRTFFVQINNITDKDEIYTSRDLEELQTIINETTVNKFRGSTFPLKLTPPPSPANQMFKIPPLPVQSNDVPLTEQPLPLHPYFTPPPTSASHKIETLITVKASRKRENLLLLSLRILLTDLKSRSQPEQSSGTLKRKQKKESLSFLLFLCLQEWLDANVKKQSEAKSSDNPVLVVKDIEAKQGKLDRELLYLLNKAKYYVPKPKVNETGTTHVFFTSTVT